VPWFHQHASGVRFTVHRPL